MPMYKIYNNTHSCLQEDVENQKPDDGEPSVKAEVRTKGPGDGEISAFTTLHWTHFFKLYHSRHVC